MPPAKQPWWRALPLHHADHREAQRGEPMRFRAVVALTLTAMSCGDPAAQFVGTWVGHESVTLTTSSGGSESADVGTVQLVLVEDLNSGKIRFDSCGITGAVQGSKVELDHDSTPCRVTEASSTNCGVTLTI